MDVFEEGAVLNYKTDMELVKVRIEREATDSVYRLHNVHPDMNTLWVVTLLDGNHSEYEEGEEIVALENQLGHYGR